MKRQNQIRAIVLSLGLGVNLLIPLPARAVSLDNPLDGIIEQLQQQFESVRGSLQGVIDEKIASVTEHLGSDLDAAVGSLGLPDILGTREKLEGSQKPGVGGIYEESLTANEIDRLTTRLGAAASLSEEGQAQQLKSLQQTGQTVELSQQEATAAQGEVVTQNVMKRIARQNQLSASVLGDIRAGQVRQQQSQDLANTNLANISESIDGRTRKEASENLGAGFDLLRISSMSRLF